MVLYESVMRLLSDPKSEYGTFFSGDSDGGRRGTYEFIAVVMWYVAIVSCCIVPTCCAYRRRRRLARRLYLQQRRYMELFFQQQQEAAAAAVEGIETTATMMGGNTRGGNSVFIWSASSGNIYYGGNEILALESLEGDIAVWERWRRLEVAMKETTFVVKEGDIIGVENCDNDVNNSKDFDNECNQKSKEDYEGKNDNDEGQDEQINISTVLEEKDGAEDDDEKDVEQGLPSTSTAIDIDEIDAELQLPIARLDSSSLPKNDGNDSRNETVPAMCAICICPYEIGDRVTYNQGTSASLLEQDLESGEPVSPTISRCPHAFHTDCILQWLAKKTDAHPECPCCRRPFCSVAPLTTADLMTLNTATIGGGLGTARAAETSTSSTISTTRMGRTSIPRMMAILPAPDIVAFPDA